MTLRIVTICTTGFLLAIIFCQSFVHWMIMNADRVRTDPEFWHMLPLGMLAFTLLVGWPLTIVPCIALFIQYRIPCVILLSSSVIYVVILFAILARIYLNDLQVSGLSYLFFPIFVSLYILLPLWLLTIGLEIYFHWRHCNIQTEP